MAQGKPDQDSAILGGPQIDVRLEPSADGASFEAWRGHQAFAGAATLVEPGDAAAFHAEARLYTLGSFVYSEAAASHRYVLRRTPEDVVRTGIDHLTINLHLAGAYSGVADGAPFLAQPGDVSFIDYGRPFEFEVSAFRSHALTVPRSAMPESMRHRDLAGLIAPSGSVATEFLIQTIRAFGLAVPKMTRPEAEAAARAIVSLADGASCHTQRRDLRSNSKPHLKLYDRARAEIATNLGVETLSPETIAGKLGVSRTTLYNLFKPRGGIQAYIRECRLHACYETLASDLRPDETIGAIAARYGFPREAHFSRAFKQRYGVTPKQMRMLGRSRGVTIEHARQDALPTVLMATLGGS